MATSKFRRDAPSTSQPEDVEHRLPNHHHHQEPDQRHDQQEVPVAGLGFICSQDQAEKRGASEEAHSQAEADQLRSQARWRPTYPEGSIHCSIMPGTCSPCRPEPIAGMTVRIRGPT